MENTVIRGQPTAGQASENEFAGEPRGNIKRSPASLRFGRGADRPRGSYGSSPDYSIAGSGGSGVDWMIPPVSGGLPPLLCLEDNNYSAYSLRGQRIARACLYIYMCVWRTAVLHGGRQGELKSVSARRCFAARLHYNGDTCDRLSPVPLCIFSTSGGRCAFNRRRMFLCFFIFFFYDGEVVMEDGLGVFFLRFVSVFR